jgi:hypothetical protein
MIRDAQTLNDLVVENPDPAGCDRAHCQLFVAGNAELAHKENVEWRAERASHFRSDGNPAARQRENENIRPIGVTGQLLREPAAGIGAIAKS